MVNVNSRNLASLREPWGPAGEGEQAEMPDIFAWVATWEGVGVEQTWKEQVSYRFLGCPFLFQRPGRGGEGSAKARVPLPDASASGEPWSPFWA